MPKQYIQRIGKKRGFTLVELMLVIAIIAMMASIAVPNYLRVRMRSQASKMKNDLRMIDNAIDQYALEANRKGTDAITAPYIPALKRYIKPNTELYSLFPNDFYGNPYVFSTFSEPPQIHPNSFKALIDVAPADFWSPYYSP